MRIRRAAFACFAATTAACALVAGLEDDYRVSGPDDAPADGAPLDGAPGPGEDGPCSYDAGPSMVLVQAEAGSYCIDTTEVTQAQYDVFLRAKALDTNGQPPECATNNDFRPHDGRVADAADTKDPCSLLVYEPNARAGYPVTCVDWCDALAYCRWAGKRLCQRVGGGTNSLQSYDTSEWFLACTRDRKREFPYGKDFKESACVGPGSNGRVEPVQSHGDCAGGYEGIVDMSGNAIEWDDSCDDSGSCAIRGGSAGATKSYELSCGFFAYGPRRYKDSVTGIRCCADPLR
jgi:formylglycine-generating enzyme required for sulfatase activity